MEITLTMHLSLLSVIFLLQRLRVYSISLFLTISLNRKNTTMPGLQELVDIYKANQDRGAKTPYLCEFSKCGRPKRHLIQSGR